MRQQQCVVLVTAHSTLAGYTQITSLPPRARASVTHGNVQITMTTRHTCSILRSTFLRDELCSVLVRATNSNKYTANPM